MSEPITSSQQETFEALAKDQDQFRLYVIVKLHELNAQVSQLKDGHKALSSSVNDYEDTKREINTAKKVVGGFALIIAAIWGCIHAAFEIIGWIKGAK